MSEISLEDVGVLSIAQQTSISTGTEVLLSQRFEDGIHRLLSSGTLLYGSSSQLCIPVNITSDLVEVAWCCKSNRDENSDERYAHIDGEKVVMSSCSVPCAEKRSYIR